MKNISNKKLFLDDVRFPENVQWMNENNYLYQEPGWDIVRNYDEFVKYIKEGGLPGLIAFDHDLEYQIVEDEGLRTFNGEVSLLQCNYDTNQPNGLDCAKWLVDYLVETEQRMPFYICHSMNPMGKEDILAYLGNAEKHLYL